MKRVLLVAVLLLYAAYAFARPTEQPGLAEQLLALPGDHAALAPGAPDGYDILPLADILARRITQKDFWLFAPENLFNNPDVEARLRPWLSSNNAIFFPNKGESIYWLTIRDAEQRLAYLRQSDLQDEINPTQMALLLRMHGDELRRVENFRGAVTTYEQSLALKADDTEANAGLGAALIGIGRNEQAIPYLQNAVSLTPDHYWAHRLLGVAYLNLERYALAADELTQADLLLPTEPHLLMGIALGLGRSGQTDQALRTLDQLASRTDDPKLLSDAAALRSEFTGQTP
ncbi:MAG: tetratricopeptide repeat protein [Caldilineales bacterium]|nr:tetratricopeptide repeat protein [Caldilineales bacterium]